MRRLLLLMLTIVVSTMVLAGDVTPQQAWEKAKEFMQSREVTGSRRAHGSLTQKGQTSRVNGLYVFNVSNNGVSLLYRTTTALILFLVLATRGIWT